ncbi:hypothetical protein TCAL_15723 [Tigriopus californicus]|uniref:N-acetyltransferase domain-containing protein n=2 Tax=Tigriopus californicus TaxID=6832 RepID=A0A553P896_TIGCA|nr:uncharacterized protein LOC131877887 isoform X2 [Tigriopus californicus]XP_059079696.1 uncharacterized protein LOC131877887 isoform X2 [Tigriopus californicus]TRY73904.1 hypothetical protein TCAL_15723 [Tigriopus californicus]
MESDEDATYEINIRQIGTNDHIDIVKLFQSFDIEKYKFIRISELQNNNTKTLNGKNNLSLAGLRIDERGGIYLNPLLDTNSAYFKCYVAEDANSHQLIGYVLFFNTLDERANQVGAGDDPVAVIEDLFVSPTYRGRGIATQLFRKVLKSSLDRGCFSCECLLIPESAEGLRFWKRRVGENRIQALLNENRGSHELIVELNRMEMKAFFEKTALGAVAGTASVSPLGAPPS